MNCPHCNEILEVDGEWTDSDIELSNDGDAQGTITCMLICKACSENLIEHELQIDQDVTEFTDAHNGKNHELDVELTMERFIARGAEVGASATVYVTCTCGRVAEFEWSDTELLSDVLGRM